MPSEKTMKQDELTRRQWLKVSVAAGAAICVGPFTMFHSRAAEAGKTTAINIASHRELFVDDFLIASMIGAELKLHKPKPRDVVLVCDAPWEGNTSAYFTLFRDEDRFRMYYRGWHYDVKTKKMTHPSFACYAESRDGVHWNKPDLGLFEFNGSKRNNIIWSGEGTHNFTPFKDGNPAGAPDARYKALAGGTTRLNGKRKGCLNAFKSRGRDSLDVDG